MTKYSELIAIKMKPEEREALEKVADELGQPISTVARGIIMRAIGPLREDGIIEMEDGSIGYRKDHPIAKSEKAIAKMDAIRLMRSEMKAMQDKLDELQIQEIVSDR